MLHVERVTIIGTGLLGTSVGLGLKAAPGTRGRFKGELVGVGRRQETLEVARVRGAFDRVTTDYAEAVSDGALVVVAVNLGAFGEVFDRIAATGKRVVVTDVGSTKAVVAREAERRLGTGQVFVGSHPMAGSEHQGPEAAEAGLFRGKPCVVCVGGDASTQAGREAESVVEGLWRVLGMTVLRMTPEEHDRQVAAISHLPHLLAVALVGLAEEFRAWDVASTGFRGATRLAASNPPMRADIVETNREPIARALEALRGEVDAMIPRVRSGERAELLAVFEAAQRRRAEWLRTHLTNLPADGRAMEAE